MGAEKNLLNYYFRSFTDDNRSTFKKKEGVEVSYTELTAGMLSTGVLAKLQKREALLQGELEYLISPVTWVNETDWQEFITPILIPAKLKEQQLQPIANRPPYIPRIYLEPAMKDRRRKAFFIGSVDLQDQFIKEHPYVADEDWAKALSYAKQLLRAVAGKSWSSFEIKGYQQQEHGWLIPQSAQIKSDAISNLYQDLLEKNQFPPLLTNFLSLTEQKRQHIQPLSKWSEKHAGQMNGQYSLSSGQRESLQHLQSLKSGHMLAVNGPPGTGKTTLLQNVVATKWIETAITEEEPPIIWATSANNQPIMNLIHSFAQAKSAALGKSKQWGKQIQKLQNRWITDIHSYALYFPSNSALKELPANHHYQIASKSENLMKQLEEKDLGKRKSAFLQLASNYLEKDVQTVSEACQLLHAELMTYHQAMQEWISIGKQWEKSTEEITQKYGSGEKLNHTMQLLVNELSNTQTDLQAAKKLQQDWQIDCKKQPWHWKILSFLPSIREKQQQRAIDFLHSIPTHLSLERTAKTFIEVNQAINTYYTNIEQIFQDTTHRFQTLDQMLKKRDELAKQVSIWQQNYLVDDPKQVNDFAELTSKLDTSLRYLLFLLATHYWEARWLLEIEEIQHRRKQNKSKRPATLRENRIKMYYRYAKLTPCFVSTLHMLPKQMWAKGTDDIPSGDQPADHYLYDFIDLLIMDEAGQVTPQVAAPSFSLAKQAIIVGDTLQIEPISNVDRPVDIGNLIHTQVANNWQQAINTESLGIMASAGSVMHIAQRRSPYQKSELFGGMFLAEHRRCLNEIISYCNQLAYDGQLIPLRGEENKYSFLPAMGYAHIEGGMEPSGGSKMNIAEADAIANWLEKHQQQILAAANQQHNTKKLTLQDIISIITPFKHQETLIKMFLKEVGITGITVGTVHALQGAERDIILFSPVDTTPGQLCFYDRGVNMMNVAVSRARDSFLTFTNWDQFGQSVDTPSFYLKEHILEENCLFEQKAKRLDERTLVHKLIQRKTVNVEEKTIIQQIIHIHNNEGQINISGENGKQTNTFQRS